jgi:hypothetical protein
MQTSNAMKKCLKAGIVTTEMLSLAIFSFNKRAKNMRDKEQEYRYHPDYRQEYHEKKVEYYSCKKELLGYFQPCEIHTVKRIQMKRYLKGWVNVMVTEKYLFYIVGDKSFHSPLPLGDKYNHLPVVHLEELQTFGKDPSDLLSVQMARKILKGLRDGTLRYVGDEMTQMAA